MSSHLEQPSSPQSRVLFSSNRQAPDSLHTELASPPAPENASNRTELPSASLWTLVVMGSILVSIPLLSEAVALWREGRLWLQRRHDQRIPCRHCRYFANTLYLKCAVRPYDVFTERAIDCSDYCPRTPHRFYGSNDKINDNEDVSQK